MSFERRPVGRTGLTISTLGLGTAGLGNLFEQISDETARETVAAALAADIIYLDTAPFYGRGLSERRVGDAVRAAGNVIVSTKVGRLLDPDATIRDDRERDGFRSDMPFRVVPDYSRDGILRSWEDSLQRLGLGRIDLLYIHDIGARTHGTDHPHYWHQLTEGGGLETLEELRAAGEIAGFGLGVNEVEICLEVMRLTRLDAILLAGRYTLLEPDGLDMLGPACAAAGTAIIVGGPYNSGILATGVNGPGPAYYDYAPAPPEVIARVAAIEAIARRYDVPLAAAALQFPLAHPQVASVIPGVASPERVEMTLAAMRADIPDAFWNELRDESLLPVDRDPPCNSGSLGPPTDRF